MARTARTVTGTVTETRFMGLSQFGNPQYAVTLSDGQKYRTEPDSIFGYSITNSEYQNSPHTFHIDSWNRIANIKRS